MTDPRGAGSGRWVYLGLSALLLLASWAVSPERARELGGEGRRAAVAWYERFFPSDAPGSARDGEPLASSSVTGDTPGGLATGAADGRRITLFLPSRALPGLLEPVEASLGAVETPKEMVVEAVNLLASPPPTMGLTPAIPARTRVLAMFIESGRLFVSLSADWLATPPGSSAEARVQLFALVNTLTSLPFADEVRFLVANEERLAYFDLFDLTTPYRFNPEIVARSTAPGASP